MSDAAEILVIIISVFLGLFLLLGIVLVVLLIKVTKQIQSVTNVAKNTADHVNMIVTTASKATAPAMIAKLMTEQVTKYMKKRK